MTELQANTRVTVVPCMRYRDAHAAIKWLCDSFGFEAKLVVPDEQGGVAHAQLSFGNGMIMLGSARDDDYGHLIKPSEKDGAAGTQSCYLIVNDADLMYARAKGAGARIEIEIEDADYGGRGFTCRDPEGHIWSFGTYDPWV